MKKIWKIWKKYETKTKNVSSRMPSWKTIAIIHKINHKDSKDSNGIQDQIQGKLRKEIQSIKSFRAQAIKPYYVDSNSISPSC